MISGVRSIFSTFRAAVRDALALFPALAQVKMAPAPRSFPAFSLSAVCILTLAGILAIPDAFAQLNLAAKEQKCRDAEWIVRDHLDLSSGKMSRDCSVKSQAGSGASYSGCILEEGAGNGRTTIDCVAVFGSNYDFPQKPAGVGVAAGPHYAFNCGAGKIPETINTIGATECCSAASGQIATHASNNQCVCPAGDTFKADLGKCVPSAALIAEIEKTNPGPGIAAVRALLNQGVSPDITTSAGLPLLFAAGRLGHADIVSVLVTFGVNASVKIDNRFFPEYMSENGLPGGADAATGRGVLPWRDAAEVVIHFGEALKVFALTSTVGTAYDWANTKGVNWPLDYLRHRYDKFDSVKNDPATVAAVKAMAGYMLDQGSPCHAGAWGVNHALCTSRPKCPAIGGPLYSCSECGGYPHFSGNGAACLAECSHGTLNTAAWPETMQCVCDNGHANPAGECPSPLDGLLVAEVENPHAVLSSVRALLNDGADTAAVGAGGIPLLFAAGRRGHADIVSVLVTFGVNTTVQFGGFTFPEYMSANGFNFKTGRATISWRDAAEVVIHFGEALKVFALTSDFGTAYDWANTKGSYWPVEHLRSRHDSGALVKSNPEARAVMEARAAMKVMAGYMLDQGSICPAQWADHAVCASRPECRTTGGPLYSCSECGGYPTRTLDGASCVVQCQAPRAVLNTEAWPSSQCECEHGRVNASGECPTSAEGALAAEIQKPFPVLSSVRALLGSGRNADPNWIGDDGVPLLLVAATLGHAKIVSVLVTAGANPQAADFSYYDLDVVQHAATPLDDRAAGPRALRASVLYHFGGGLDVRNAASGDADFNWNRGDKNGVRALDILHRATGTVKITLAGEDRDIIDEMANYMLARGAQCGGHTSGSDRTQGVCVGSGQVSLVRTSLFAELEKAPGTADTSEFLRLLGEEGGHLEIENSARRPLLILAARQGHADLVSVLVTAGANVNAVDATFYRLNVAHHMATHLNDPAAGPRSLRASVLYHFSGALDVRNARSGDADFDWNQQDQNGSRALDILVKATAADKLALEGENLTVIHEMAEHLRGEGARCGYRTSNNVREVCLGSAGLPLARALVDAVKDPNTSADEVRAAAQAVLAFGANPDDIRDGSGHILAAAAQRGHAAAVSVLLTFGVNPDGRIPGGRGVLHLVGRNSASSAPLQLRILRHFLGGLEAAGKADSFNGWNAHVANVGGRPLDALQAWGSAQEELAAKREIQALLYERGARCGSAGSKTYCQLPAETVLIPANLPDTGPVLTVTTRDFGGASFDLRLPDADVTATLGARGWRMDYFYGPPRRVVLSRTGALSSGDGLPTVAITMLNGKQAVRQINIVGQSGFFPFSVTIVGFGSVSIMADGKPVQNGGGVLPNQYVEIVATPDTPAYHVSGWSGPCAVAPKGADGGERTCELIFNGEDNRVTVTFSPGRLAPHLPASGNVPDHRWGLFKDTGTNALDYFCGLFDAPSVVSHSVDLCDVFGSDNPNRCEGTGPGYSFGSNVIGKCGSTHFRHIRNCNAENKPAASRNSCGEACNAAAGMVARGRSCQEIGDQCAAPPACAARAVCSDPDVARTNTPAELCACTGGLAGDGLTCGEEFASPKLVAEVQKPPGAASVSAVRTLLGLLASPNAATADGVPALIVAVTLGHAEIVSVLVTAGASLNARYPGSENLRESVPHIAARNNDGSTLRYSWRTALNVLRHFSDAVNQSGAAYDWTSTDIDNFRAVELLEFPYSDFGAEWGGESVSVKYAAMEEMADILLSNGDDCLSDRSWAGHVTCQGSLRAALAEVVALGAAETSAADVRAAAQAAADAGINLKTAQRTAVGRKAGDYVVAIAASRGHAEAVSILVAFGADAGGKMQNGRAALHYVGLGGDTNAPAQLTVLRHFIGGLRAAGKLDAFAGWNDALGDNGDSPLDLLQTGAAQNSDDMAAKRELQKLLWEGGSRCATPADKTYCQVPRESRIAAAYLAGDGLTVSGRDFRGTVFVFSSPPPELAAQLATTGWEALLASSEEEFVVLRTRQPLPSDRPVEFTVTAFAGAGGDAVRIYDIEAAGATVGVRYATVPADGSFGGVSVSGEGLTGANAAYAGSRVTFTALPEPGYGVFAWEIDGADCPRGDLECAAVAPVDSDLLVTARFALTNSAGYGEIPDDKSGGTLTAEGLAGEDGVFSGTTVTFRARPAAGWLLSAWEGDGAGCSPSDLECALSADDDGLFVTVRFTQGRLVEYQADPSDESGGTLTVAGLARDNAAMAGALVTFTASPAPGWELSAWEGDVGSCAAPDLECILTADDDLRVTASFSQAPRVGYAANPSDESGGRVTVAGVNGSAGGADFAYSGGTVTFTATPVFGWEVSAWEGDVGDCVAPALECAAAVNKDLFVTVGFSRVTVRVEAATIPAEGGSVTVRLPGLDYAFLGSDVTFTATPADGWYAAGWEGLGTAGCAGLECVVMVATEADVLVTVRFAEAEARTVRVEYASDPPYAGTLSAVLPGLDFAFLGATVTFTATPSTDWFVEGWAGEGTAGCAARPQCEAAADGDLYVTVRFAPLARATVGVAYETAPEGGRLTVELPGLDFAFAGATVTFEATPMAGWIIAAWEGDASGQCSALSLICVLIAGSDLAVGARFTQGRLVEYQADPSDESGGTLTVAGLARDNAAMAGALVTFTASPAPGWELSAWRGDVGSCVAPDLECILTADDDLRVTASFSRAPRVGYAANPSDESGGRVTVAGVDGNANGADFVYSGGMVTFTATPVFGWELSAWEGCSSSGLECVLTANNDVQVTAHFSQAPRVGYAANPSDESGGRVTVAGAAGNAGGADFAYSGGTVTFTASPAPGWELSAWRGDVGSCVAPDLECILTADDDLRVTASFSRAPRVGYAANPSDESGGRVTVAGVDGNANGADFVYSGGMVTFTATPVFGWELSAWEGCSSSGLECVLTANNDVQVTAHFSQAPRVGYAANPSDESGGRVTVAGAAGNAGGADFAYSGGTVTFTASPAPGWELSAWRGDVGSCVAPDLECILTADDDLRVTASFSRAPRVGYAANPSDESGGRVTVAGVDGNANGADFVYSGGMVTFTAAPVFGWELSAWEGCLSSGLECVLTANNDVQVTAHFSQAPRVGYAANPSDESGGRVTVAGVAGNAGGADFAYSGGTVTFTATPAIGWEVSAWEGDVGDCVAPALECAAAVNKDLFVTVRFAPLARATVGVAYETAPEGGELSAELPGENFAFEGATVTFTATPMAGWTIAAWEGDASGQCSASSLICVLIAGSDLSVGVRFGERDCVAKNREESGSACGECKTGYGEMGGYCISKTGDFGTIPQLEICRALQGGGEAARLEGDGEMKVCSDVDANGTFCILDSVDGLPCRGLFRHVLRCNVGFNRLALNPFFCGKECGAQKAAGAGCR